MVGLLPTLKKMILCLFQLRGKLKKLLSLSNHSDIQATHSLHLIFSVLKETLLMKWFRNLSNCIVWIFWPKKKLAWKIFCFLLLYCFVTVVWSITVRKYFHFFYIVNILFHHAERFLFLYLYLDWKELN